MPETTYYCENTNDGSATTQEGSFDSGSWPNPYLDAYPLGAMASAPWKYGQGYTVFNLASPYAGDAIPAGATIGSAVFSLFINPGGKAFSTAHSVYAALHDWLPSLDMSEWCNRAAMAALYDGGAGLFASLAVSGGTPDATRHDFAGGAKMLADIAACIGGSLPLVLFCEHHMNGVTPADNDFAWFSSANDSHQEWRPKLVVQWSVAGGGGTQFRRAPGVLRLGSRGVRE